MNKSKTYKGLLIRRKDKSKYLIFEKVEIARANSLEQLYFYLRCDNIDIQERYINNKIYDFIFDGEYLINGKSQEPQNAVAMGEYNGKLQEVIFSDLLIVGVADQNGAETSLKESDINNILKSLLFVEHSPTNKHYQCLRYTIFKENKNND